jgi:L-galactose dehydrogenase/L-glyceraldehyde 3-phosphate reductase
MLYRPLGTTGIPISAVAFGAGPVSTLMVGEDASRQRAVIEYALESGINWFDTAATYGDGQSERSLGAVLRELPDHLGNYHLATKVRLLPADLADIGRAVRRSVEGSLERLGVGHVTLLQLHNSVTRRRGDEPTSITPDDVLGRGGALETMRELQAAGVVRHLGLTGIGDPASLRAVIASDAFATIQVPYHLLNPSAGRDMPADFSETNYGNVIASCADAGMGVLAIRVLAGGALADNEPSPHTRKTPFFPLALYERDRARAARLREWLGPQRQLPVEAIRFAISHPQISAALIGFAEAWQIDQALAALDADAEPVAWDRMPAMA